MSATVLKCPGCRKPLSVGAEVLAGRKVFYVYCPFGPCRPSELGDEFRGASVAEAFGLLDKTYREWLEAQPE